MAVTYGTLNLGSSSNGGFAIYPVATTASEAVSILKADFSTNTVEAVPGAVPLTALQRDALSTLLDALRTAQPTADTLAILRKLVGVLSMTDGITLTLSKFSVGDIHTLVAVPSLASKLLVYVPNSAASGPFTGSGAETGVPVVIPTTQRYEAVANVPGLYLPGVACLSVPNPAGLNSKTITFDTNLLSGYAVTGATLQRDFRVEKIDMSAADPGVGLGTLMFLLRFGAGGAAGNQQATVQSPSSFSVLPGWLYRIVNPAGADASLADVAFTLVGGLPL